MGFYAISDLATEDKEGYRRLLEENKIINVGGLKVLPQEVEDTINKVDGVIDSTVFSEDNNIIGNIVCAKIFTECEDKKN